MASVHRHSQSGDSALGVVILIVALVLGTSWAFGLGLELPDLRNVGQSIAGLGPARVEEAGPATAPAAAPIEQPSPSAPHCAPGASPAFVHGFAELRRQVGPAMGEAVECEHTNPENGDAIQQTSTGLAYYRKATNTPSFTDGWKHWALTATGMVTWTGESADPPPDATAEP